MADRRKPFEKLAPEDRAAAEKLTPHKGVTIGPKPEPPISRKILELLTGMPAEPGAEVGPADLVMNAPYAPLMGVTHFLVGGVPSKLAREAGTDAFRRAATDMGLEGGEQFASKFPRIAAHMDLQDLPLLTQIQNFLYGPKALGATNIRQGSKLLRVPVEMQTGLRPDVSANTLFHEGTHVAQTLGNKDYPDLIGNIEEAMRYELKQRGLPVDERAIYLGAPDEVSARYNAGKHAPVDLPPGPGNEIFKQGERPAPFMTRVEEILARFSPDNPHAVKARELVARRRGGKP